MSIPVTQVDVSAYTIPTDLPEADGTLEWDSTTIVVVEVHAGGKKGTGYTYADLSAARVADRILAPLILGKDATAVGKRWSAMVRSVRNIGRAGIASHAIAAVDIALWDLKAHLLNVPLAVLLGGVRRGIPVYGSGGFTSYSVEQIQEQFAGWVGQGITKVKMRVGANPAADLHRVRAAKQAIGGDVDLFVDADGAYTRKQALDFAEHFAAHDVKWFEEPVPADDLDSLRLIRDRAPAGMDIAAGEYGYDTPYFRRLLDEQAVDVLQADATRCAGVTGFLEAAALASAHEVPLSAHTAPSIHAHLCCAVRGACHVEYFHDHVRIERMLFDNVLEPVDGFLRPDPQRPGLGLELKSSDAVKYAA
jgi:L-alanine-DL-glutamate epimerase-like enolase superfamily enzyme